MLHFVPQLRRLFKFPLPDLYLPDKAIDLLDEAAAAARIRAADTGVSTPVLTAEDIAQVVSRISGVPAQRVGEEQRARLERLEQELAGQVVGQPRAVAAVAGAIRRSRTGLRESGRPIGAMLDDCPALLPPLLDLACELAAQAQSGIAQKGCG